MTEYVYIVQNFTEYEYTPVLFVTTELEKAKRFCEKSLMEDDWYFGGELVWKEYKDSGTLWEAGENTKVTYKKYLIK